jgi:hypothetical protein
MNLRSFPPSSPRQRRQRPLSRSDRRFPANLRQGLSPIEVEALYAQQQGTCAIGGEPLPPRYTVDHDHTLAAAHGHDPTVGCKGCVRGLLCHRHNRALGSFRDDAEALARAARYVVWRRRAT